jgi:hypothetical protein
MQWAELLSSTNKQHGGKTVPMELAFRRRNEKPLL